MLGHPVYSFLFQSCARLRKESRRCLSHSKKLTADRADVVKGLKEQLDALHVSEGLRALRKAFLAPLRFIE